MRLKASPLRAVSFPPSSIIIAHAHELIPFLLLRLSWREKERRREREMQISLVQRIYIHLVKKTGDLESMVERSWRNFFLSSNPNWLRIILFLGIFPKFVMKSKSITSSLERFLDRFERFLRSLRIVEMLRFPSFLPSGRESVFRLCNPRGLQRVGRGQIGSVHLRY